MNLHNVKNIGIIKGRSVIYGSNMEDYIQLFINLYQYFILFTNSFFDPT